MTQKVSKGIRKVPRRGTKAYAVWHRKLVSGMRQARLRRREAGWVTVAETATELALSQKAVRQVFHVIKIGSRSFIRRNEIEKWKRETGADAA